MRPAPTFFFATGFFNEVDQYESELIISVPARLPRAFHVGRLIEFLKK